MCWIEYLGVEKDFAEQPTIFAIPYKKQRNQQELPAEEEKEYNKIHSKKKRIVIEHTIICRLKKYRVYLHIYLETN
jgi:hypothetical protein